MKLLQSPPPIAELVREVFADDQDRFQQLSEAKIHQLPKGKYPHWNELRYRKPPKDFTLGEWWFSKKLARMGTSRQLPFKDKNGRPFSYSMPDSILRMSSEVDRDASGQVSMPYLVTHANTRDTYLVNSLIEEAITSSQLEGASTTRKVAKEMLRKGRSPHTKSEQMIHNNYRAMQFIREVSDQNLNSDVILELQRIVTDSTLEDPSGAGRWRRPEEDIKVVDPRDNTELHVPPDANEIPERIELLCAFANGKEGETYIHPIWRAILLHMMLGYDHPFVDGNGRTARALFYWSMSRQGYWLTEFVTISKILRTSPARYARSFLYVTTDDNDTTYFIHYQLRVLLRAIKALQEYLQKKMSEIRETEHLLQGSNVLSGILNPRQLALINHALKNPDTSYEIEAHRKAHSVTYETARTDLLTLSNVGLLTKRKRGRAYVFWAPADFRECLENLSTDIKKKPMILRGHRGMVVRR